MRHQVLRRSSGGPRAISATRGLPAVGSGAPPDLGTGGRKDADQPLRVSGYVQEDKTKCPKLRKDQKSQPAAALYHPRISSQAPTSCDV